MSHGLLGIKAYLEVRAEHLEGLMEKGTASHGYAKQSLGASRDEVMLTLDLVNYELRTETPVESTRKPKG